MLFSQQAALPPTAIPEVCIAFLISDPQTQGLQVWVVPFEVSSVLSNVFERSTSDSTSYVGAHNFFGGLHFRILLLLRMARKRNMCGRLVQR